MTPDELEAIKKQTEKWIKTISDNCFLNYGGLPDDLAALDKAIDLYRPLIMEVQHLQTEVERLQTENEALKNKETYLGHYINAKGEMTIITRESGAQFIG